MESNILKCILSALKEKMEKRIKPSIVLNFLRPEYDKESYEILEEIAHEIAKVDKSISNPGDLIYTLSILLPEACENGEDGEHKCRIRYLKLPVSIFLSESQEKIITAKAEIYDFSSPFFECFHRRRLCSHNCRNAHLLLEEYLVGTLRIIIGYPCFEEYHKIVYLRIELEFKE